MATTAKAERNDGPVNEPDFFQVARGWKTWAVTLDHKRIGMMYLFGILISLLIGGAFALIVRAELFLPGKQIVSGDSYNNFFTLHLLEERPVLNVGPLCSVVFRYSSATRCHRRSGVFWRVSALS